MARKKRTRKLHPPAGTSLDAEPTRSAARRYWAFAAMAVIGGLAVASLLAWSRKQAASPPEIDAALTTSISTASTTFAGSAACAGCHAEQYRPWQESQHALAMQVATEESVLGDFSGVKFTHMGITSEFFRRDGAFMVRTDGPDGRLADYELRHTFGIYPLQQYLLELPGGRLQALPIAWDARPRESGGGRWFHLYRERIGHRDELHWTRRQQNWNYMCADCHSTNLQKNYDAVGDTYATSWSEISVGCEACHGPGSEHVRLATLGRGSEGLTVALDERRGAAWTIDTVTGNARRNPPRATARELDVCAQCHSRRGQYSNTYRAGEPFLDHYRPALLESGLYHPDGQQREEVYDWGSFLSSRMHAAGVTCSDCHEPHAGKLRAPGNAVCGQCHAASKYEATTHHMHALGTPASECKACHMPTETYMLIDPRHDHSFRIPRPDVSANLRVPNACTQCHTDRSPEWAAAAIRLHHPQPKSGFQHFGDGFAAADRGEPGATPKLIALAVDPSGSPIARASAFDRLARRPDRAAVEAAQAALADESPLVRVAALSVIESLPPLERHAAAPLLNDPVRTVRMTAARTLAGLAADALGEQAAAFDRAAAEYVAAERFNADRPEHRVNLGNFLAERGELAAAEVEYQAALKLEPRFVPASVNLAEMQRTHGREPDAEATLRSALESVPRNADLHHALGLSLVRQQRTVEALRELEAAARAAPDNARYAFVHAVGLHSVGRVRDAIAVLEQASRAAPSDRDVLEALALYYGEIGEDVRAARTAERLRTLDRGTPR